MTFPADFRWGVATAAYQIEGAVDVDGRGESIWDRFSHTPGKTFNGDTGDLACDHYHRYGEDVELMARLGIRAYRFSIAWPRLFPSGAGRPNRKGIDFYARLVDRLLADGIAPAITLYHWDLPQALQDTGGWANRDTARRFGDYADAAFRALGDRVALWITHNEPWVAAFLGHFTGDHAPGVADLRTALAAAHHLLLSHGLAVDAYRGLGLSAPIGITLNLYPTYPHSDTSADVEAALTADGYTNRWFLDPVLRATYPDDMLALFADRMGPLDFVRDGDLSVAGRAIDFLGVNYYTRGVIRAAPAQPFGYEAVDPLERRAPVTDMPTEIAPDALTDLLARLKRDYREIPLYITENGAAFNDRIDADGQVRDARRVEFLRSHFAAAARAIEKGVPLRGYFVWSFMDNFEWAYGYSKRFGLVYVDYATQRRVPKSSASFFREVIEQNEIPEEAAV
ncbi:MAG: GH1 family beta-glucosidase [Chloroflexota bacterium]|nr:GH1 family beta-glucosidase [Chloroflexota bacterium]